MWDVWHCSWPTVQLFEKFFSLLRCVRIDPFLFFTARCPYSCLIHWHIKSLSWWRIQGSNLRPIACKATALPTELIPQIWSEYKDSNLGPPGPKPGALPDCATLRKKSTFRLFRNANHKCCTVTCPKG